MHRKYSVSSKQRKTSICRYFHSHQYHFSYGDFRRLKPTFCNVHALPSFIRQVLFCFLSAETGVQGDKIICLRLHKRGQAWFQISQLHSQWSLIPTTSYLSPGITYPISLFPFFVLPINSQFLCFYGYISNDSLSVGNISITNVRIKTLDGQNVKQKSTG